MRHMKPRPAATKELATLLNRSRLARDQAFELVQQAREVSEEAIELRRQCRATGAPHILPPPADKFLLVLDLAIDCARKELTLGVGDGNTSIGLTPRTLNLAGRRSWRP